MAWKKITLAVGATALSICALAVGLAMKGASHVAGAVVGAGLEVGVKQAMAPVENSNATFLNKAFLQMQEQTKPTLPQQMEGDLVFFDVSVDGTMVTYRYRHTDHPAAFYGPNLVADQRVTLKSSVCGQPQILKVFNMGASFRFVYSGNDGKHVGVVTLDARACSATS